MRTQPPGVAASGQPEQLKGVRRNMARVMADAHSKVVPTTLVDDADLHAWIGKQDITARLVRAIVTACKTVPALNAWFDGDNLTRTLHPQVDIGIAVDTDDGLFVPALRNADMLDGAGIRTAIQRLRAQVEDRTIPAERTERLHDLAVQLRHVRRPLRDAGGGAAVRGDRRRRQAQPRRGRGDRRHRSASPHADLADFRPPRLHRRRGGALPEGVAGRHGTAELIFTRDAPLTEIPTAGPGPPLRRTTMAHRSRLAGFIIDCQTDDLDPAASFWSQALGVTIADPDAGDVPGTYQMFGDTPADLHIEVQKVDHPSRVHLDIESDDIDAEAARLEKLGREEDRLRQTLVGDGSADRPPLLRGEDAPSRARHAAERMGCEPQPAALDASLIAA